MGEQSEHCTALPECYGVCSTCSQRLLRTSLQCTASLSEILQLGCITLHWRLVASLGSAAMPRCYPEGEWHSRSVLQDTPTLPPRLYCTLHEHISVFPAHLSRHLQGGAVVAHVAHCSSHVGSRLGPRSKRHCATAVSGRTNAHSHPSHRAVLSLGHRPVLGGNLSLLD